jgi:hypothetical protein
MTNRTLRRRLIYTAIGVILCLIVSLIEYCRHGLTGSTFISANGTLIAILFATYIAYLFQQRAKSVDDLRRWWNEIVAAKSDFFAFCDKVKPNEDEYLKSFYKISTAMDTLRLIYCNVGRDAENIRGYYPFEQIRDIVDIARSIRPSKKLTRKDRLAAKAAIDVAFQSLRHAIQSEASAAPPDSPILYGSRERTEYLSRVKRASGLDVERIRQENRQLPPP